MSQVPLTFHPSSLNRQPAGAVEAVVEPNPQPPTPNPPQSPAHNSDFPPLTFDLRSAGAVEAVVETMRAHLGGSKVDIQVQGYLAHKKQHPLLGPPQDPRYSPTVGF